MGGRSAVLVAAVAWTGVALGAAHPALAFAALVVAFAFGALAAVRYDRTGTLALLIVTLALGIARGGAAARRLERMTPPAPVETRAPPARWLIARVAAHPAREGGEPMAILALLAPAAGMPAG